MSQKHAPYPACWFAPPGAGLHLQGYPSPFYGPFGDWEIFPNMNPSHHSAPTALLPGGDTSPWEMFLNMDPSRHCAPTMPFPGGKTPLQAGHQGGGVFLFSLASWSGSLMRRISRFRLLATTSHAAEVSEVSHFSSPLASLLMKGAKASFIEGCMALLRRPCSASTHRRITR